MQIASFLRSITLSPVARPGPPNFPKSHHWRDFGGGGGEVTEQNKPVSIFVTTFFSKISHSRDN